MRKILKSIFPGVSWQNPVLWPMFRALDPLDYILRKLRGMGHLPPYSIRIRSNGVTRQFGGKSFSSYGNTLASLLSKHADISASSKVLEIGCGCGRTAFALVNCLDPGNYTGTDIEPVALEASQKNPLFLQREFRFDLLDIRNAEYNPEGRFEAESYRFPYPDNSYDVIFLVSVFTHMLTDDVKNYLAEIARLLKPGGTCMITTFLMDHGEAFESMNFRHRSQDHYYVNPAMPEITVGYKLEFYREHFSRHELEPHGQVLWGSWRGPGRVASHSGFPQDVVFFRKPLPGPDNGVDRITC